MKSGALGLSRYVVVAPAFAAWLLLGGCIDASKREAKPPSGPVATPVACANGTRPAADGALDDAEDNDTQLTKVGGRDGYWFASGDPNGSTILPSPFKMSDGGAGGSQHAVHIDGRTSDTNGSWGVLLGANMVGVGAYDASPYAGISFKAKVGPGSSKKVRFKVGDVNTHPDGGVCKNCWNHFGKDLGLTSDWQEYQISFAEMTQEAGWGDAVPAITPGKILSINWSIGPGQTYDLWLDDIAFFECK
jgi:endoglucanase